MWQSTANRSIARMGDMRAPHVCFLSDGLGVRFGGGLTEPRCLSSASIQDVGHSDSEIAHIDVECGLNARSAQAGAGRPVPFAVIHCAEHHADDRRTVRGDVERLSASRVEMSLNFIRARANGNE